ncbi:hypothetical protein FIA58_014240 [Flavobacterium jejuense]|uniref:Uncharacterized protein n=1 Tax=Flavobacterium jejuense TaxID=1544455 RepID=A0ABX0ITI3_9FLAO|nr:hypothetical protein [Flavobacterium jejuense]NHN26841.1 hypothetical protein [Flavobacterium jejuense]
MKKKYLSMVSLLFCSLMLGQVGINTTSPSAMLDIKSTDYSNPSPKDGLLIPRVNNLSQINPSMDQDGMLIYLSNNLIKNSRVYPKGFFYWDNSNTDWIPVSSDEWKSGTNQNGEPLIYSKQADASGTKIVVTDTGKFGIGTDDPVERFEFRGPGDNDFQITSANTNPPNVILYNTGGTLDNPTLLNPDQEIGALVYKTNNGNGMQEVGGIHYFIDGAPTSSSLPTKLVINTTKVDNVSDSSSFTIRANGNVGVGMLDPSAKLNLPASDGSLNSAPLKFTVGTNLVTPEEGAMEYDGNNLYFTNQDDVREILMKGIVINQNLDFPSIGNLLSQELEIAVNGLSQNSTCSCSPLGSIESGLTWSCYVTDNNTIRIRLLNASILGAIDPVSRNWKVTVFNLD